MGDSIEIVENGSGDGLERSSADPAHPDAGPGERSRRVAAAIVGYSALLALGAIALLLWGPLHGEPAIRPCSRNGGCSRCSACSGAAANWAPVSVHHRGNTGIIVLDAVPLVIGLVFLRPDWLVVGCVVSEMVVVRRPFTGNRSSRFSSMRSSTGFAVAVAAVRLPRVPRGAQPSQLRGDGPPSSPPCAAKELISTLNFRVVTKLNGQTAEGAPARRSRPISMFFAASVCLAIVVLDALWFSLRATVPLVLVAALIIVGLSGLHRLDTSLCLTAAPL